MGGKVLASEGSFQERRGEGSWLAWGMAASPAGERRGPRASGLHLTGADVGRGRLTRPHLPARKKRESETGSECPFTCPNGHKGAYVCKTAWGRRCLHAARRRTRFGAEIGTVRIWGGDSFARPVASLIRSQCARIAFIAPGFMLPILNIFCSHRYALHYGCNVSRGLQKMGEMLRL